jgi:hypothetical protein
MKPNAARMLSKRTQIVWVSFFFVIPCALFILQTGNKDIQSGMLLTSLASIDERPKEDPVFAALQEPENSHWSSIVIHHLGQPAGDHETIDRAHRSAGLHGLGFHFLIGNGNGLGDGDVQMGYRWIEQSTGARPSSIQTDRWDDGVISICLIGNGNRRPFTERQLLHLSHLVQRLQKELSIPSTRVMLASELGDINSPGDFFAEAQFRSQLLDIPRIDRLLP